MESASIFPRVSAALGQHPPPAWLLIFSGILVFSPLLEGGTTHTAAMVIRLMILSLACAYGWQAVREQRMVLPGFPIGPSVAAFLVLAAFSAATSPYRHQSLQWLVVLLSDAAALYLLVSLMGTWGQAACLLAMLAGMGVFESALALHQGYVEDIARPTGTFANPNFLSGYLAAIWSLLLGSLVHFKLGRRGEGAGRRRLLAILACVTGALFLSAIVLAGSRGGLLALSVGSVVVVVWRFGRRGLAAVALVLALALAIPNPLSERLRAEHEGSNPLGYARWQMWQGAVHQISDYPLGVGLGLYQYLYPRYALPIEGQIARYGKVAQTPHNEYAQIGVELGLPGLAVFGWGVVLLLREIRLLAGCRLRRWQRAMVVGACGAVASVLGHAAVDSNLHEPAVVMVLIACVAILLSVRRLVGMPVDGRTVLVRRPLLWSGGIGLAVILSAMLVVKMGVAWKAYEAGSRALAAKQLERAAEYLGQAIALDPGKALYHSSKAAVYFERYRQSGEEQDLSVVLDELKQSSALNPLSAKPFRLLGDVYRIRAGVPGTGDQGMEWLPLAAHAYEETVAREPFNPFYRLTLGRLYLALGEGGKAERSVSDAVHMEPNFLPGRLWLGTRYAKTGRIEPAKQEFEEILRRQRYYANWVLNAYERSFLSVNARELTELKERLSGEKSNRRHTL